VRIALFMKLSCEQFAPRIGFGDSRQKLVLASADDMKVRVHRKFFHCQSSRLRVRATASAGAAPTRTHDANDDLADDMNYS